MKTFYDIHTYAFDLSHPNLPVFLPREDLIDSLIDKVWTLPLRMALPLLSWANKNFLKKKLQNLVGMYQNQINNTLGFFEIPVEYQFLVMEHFLKQGSQADNGRIKLGDEAYDKIALCPLMIDFGRKNMKDSVYYNLTPKMPIAGQVSDLLYAIRTYFRFNVTVANKQMRLEPVEGWEKRKHEKLFEIYPFMGIDTQNYAMEDLIKLLDKYFRDFSDTETAAERHSRLFEKMGMPDGNLYRDSHPLTEIERAYLGKKNIAEDYRYAFAGIKLYPQLGFDPCPDDAAELDKVKYLYGYCIEKRIPVTTHCSDSGYKPEDFNHLTSPLGKWAKVLSDEKYAALTLNFAHFGSRLDKKKKDWRDAIIELTNRCENVYTDIDCKPAAYYTELGQLLTANPRLQERVLFGSDFSINLLVSSTNCYSDNLEAFAKAQIDPSRKKNLCELNPQRFLFGR